MFYFDKVQIQFYLSAIVQFRYKICQEYTVQYVIFCIEKRRANDDITINKIWSDNLIWK